MRKHNRVDNMMLFSGDGKPRSAAMVLSMPHTTLSEVLDIMNDQAGRASNGGEGEGDNVGEVFSVDPAAFDTVEASCKYDVYLQKQQDDMER